jgi:UTP--glucose-1-phosphate uridylyltransferase
LHPVSDPRRFGIVKLGEGSEVLGIIEKPNLEKAKSYRNNNDYLTSAGLLVLKKTIFDFIPKTKRGINNELWLTDAVELMRTNGSKLYGYVFKGKRYDIGTFTSLKEADKMEQMES